MAAKKRCPNCGTEIGIRSKKCSTCEAPVQLLWSLQSLLVIDQAVVGEAFQQTVERKINELKQSLEAAQKEVSRLLQREKELNDQLSQKTASSQSDPQSKKSREDLEASRSLVTRLEESLRTRSQELTQARQNFEQLNQTYERVNKDRTYLLGRWGSVLDRLGIHANEDAVLAIERLQARVRDLQQKLGQLESQAAVAPNSSSFLQVVKEVLSSLLPPIGSNSPLPIPPSEWIDEYLSFHLMDRRLAISNPQELYRRVWWWQSERHTSPSGQVVSPSVPPPSVASDEISDTEVLSYVLTHLDEVKGKDVSEIRRRVAEQKKSGFTPTESHFQRITVEQLLDYVVSHSTETKGKSVVEVVRMMFPQKN